MPDLPPPYEEDDGDKPGDMVEPLLLSFTNKSIASLPLAAGEEPIEMYTLSWDFMHNPKYTRDVSLHRIVRSLRMISSGDPKVKLRERPAYYFRCMTRTSMQVDTLRMPTAWACRDSRSELGNFGLRQKRRDKSVEVRSIEKATPRAVGAGLLEVVPRWSARDEKTLFSVSRGGAWKDANGEQVALAEERTGGEHTLRTSRALRRDTLDALVAVWCCRLWMMAVVEMRKDPANQMSGEFTQADDQRTRLTFDSTRDNDASGAEERTKQSV